MRTRILVGILFAIVACTLLAVFRPLTQNKKATRIQFAVNTSVQEAADQLKEKGVLKNPIWIIYASRVYGFKSIRAGSYLIEPGENLYTLTNRFRKGLQTPIKLILGNERTRLRTPKQFASKMQRFQYTQADSALWSDFLRSNDALKPLDVDTNTVMTRLLPLTYEVYWTDSPEQVYRSISRAWERFWNADRKKKAAAINLTPTQVSILASIVEEETQYGPDRPLIASTYLNRLRINMPLQADPTAKFGSGDFTAKRVTFAHLRHESPYNTYLHTGLPPGTICIPSVATIDAVLNAPKTDYLYFVASHLFDGTSVFSKDLAEHERKATRYRQELTRRLQLKKTQTP